MESDDLKFTEKLPDKQTMVFLNKRKILFIVQT